MLTAASFEPRSSTLTASRIQCPGNRARDNRSAESRAFPTLAVHHPRGDPVGFAPGQCVRAHGLLVKVLAAVARAGVSYRHVDHVYTTHDSFRRRRYRKDCILILGDYGMARQVDRRLHTSASIRWLPCVTTAEGITKSTTYRWSLCRWVSAHRMRRLHMPRGQLTLLDAPCVNHSCGPLGASALAPASPGR
jgi:hypothetical protein